jgi:hypothetical protein
LQSLFLAYFLALFKDKRREFHCKASFFALNFFTDLSDILIADDLVIDEIVTIQDLKNSLLVLGELMSNEDDAVFDYSFLFRGCSFNRFLRLLSAGLCFRLTK